MMGGIEARNNRIRHRRGDTGVLRLELFIGDTPYSIEDGDRAVFTVKRKLATDEIVLQKEMDENHEFVLQHEDTQDLRCGKYKFDVQATLHGGEVVTIAFGDYILLPDVTTEVRA